MNERNTATEPCLGCSADEGETHDLGCDHEQCPECSEQLIGCRHFEDYEDEIEAREITDFVEGWCDFSGDRAYILMAIARRKFNRDVTNAEEVIHRRVLTDGEDVDVCVRELLGMMSVHDLHFRIYLTVNAHDTVSAYHSFMQEAIGWSEELYNGHEGVHTQMGRVSSEWKSVLHKPRHRVEQLFQFDYDDVTRDEIKTVVGELNGLTEVRRVRETPNGYHVITEPFNYTEWESPVEYDELDTDGMIFVAEVDGR